MKWCIFISISTTVKPKLVIPAFIYILMFAVTASPSVRMVWWSNLFRWRWSGAITRRWSWCGILIQVLERFTSVKSRTSRSTRFLIKNLLKDSSELNKTFIHLDRDLSMELGKALKRLSLVYKSCSLDSLRLNQQHLFINHKPHI